LIELIGDLGWGILNGNKEGDKEGQWIFEGVMGSSVIDYAIMNATTWDKVRRIKIESRADSDHLPITLELTKSDTMGKKGGRNRKRDRGLIGRKYKKIQRKYGKNKL